VAQRRSNKYLGVAISEQGILVAEVANAGGRREVRRYAEFPFTEGQSAAQLAAAGKAFGTFLKQQGFHAREAVIGLPARWVVIKPKDLPPADPETASTLLRVQAEGEFSADLKEMVYDYAGESHPKQPRQVLLMAVPRERLDQIHQFAEAARITVAGVTPSVAALGAASKSLAAPEGIVVYLGGKSAELAVQTGHGLQRIRHFATAGAVAPAIGGAGGGTAVAVGPGGTGAPELVAELRRTFAGLPQNGTPPADRKLVLWDGTGLDEAQRAAIGSRLGMAVNAQNLTAMGVGGQQLTAEASRFAPAVALATAMYLPEGLPVNFDDSRLKPPVESSTRQKVTWGLAVAAVLALAIGALAYTTQAEAAKNEEMKAKLAKLGPDLQTANTLLAHAASANKWYGGETPYLNCFVAVSNAFPQSNNCYATNLDLQPLTSPLKADRPVAGAVPTTQSSGVLKGQLTGKANNQDLPKTIASNLFQSGKFKDVKINNIVAVNNGSSAGGGRGGGGGGRGAAGEYSFVIEFTFTGNTASTPGAAAPASPTNTAGARGGTTLEKPNGAK
jgi:hypothetical protein